MSYADAAPHSPDAMQFNCDKDLGASARSQSGNVIGMAGGALAADGAVAVFGAAASGAPLILTGLLLQAAWSTSDGADSAEKQVHRVLSE